MENQPLAFVDVLGCVRVSGGRAVAGTGGVCACGRAAALKHVPMATEGTRGIPQVV